MKKLTRRSFYKVLGLGGLWALVSVKAIHVEAAEAKMADPAKGTAKALGYKKVSADKARACNLCVQYKGKVTDKKAPCAAFGGLNVLATGTCVAFAKDPKKA